MFSIFFILIFTILLFYNAYSLKYTNTYANFIDLSYPFDQDTIYLPGSKKLVYTRAFEGYIFNKSWYAMREFCTGEHGGTHLDAPYHFYRNGWRVGEIPLDRLIAPGIVVDISDDVALTGPSQNLEVHHLKNWVTRRGPISEDSILLIRFGWSKYYPNVDKYLGAQNLSFPGISEEAANWIANQSRIVGVGVDTASVDSGTSRDYMAHRILSEHQIYCMENVNLMNTLPPKGFKLFVMPMNLRQGTGAPLRLIAEMPPKRRKKRNTKVVVSPQCSDGVPLLGHLIVLVSCCILFAIYNFGENLENILCY